MEYNSNCLAIIWNSVVHLSLGRAMAQPLLCYSFRFRVKKISHKIKGDNRTSKRNTNFVIDSGTINHLLSIKEGISYSNLKTDFFNNLKYNILLRNYHEIYLLHENWHNIITNVITVWEFS